MPITYLQLSAKENLYRLRVHIHQVIFLAKFKIISIGVQIGRDTEVKEKNTRKKNLIFQSLGPYLQIRDRVLNS